MGNKTSTIKIETGISGLKYISKINQDEQTKQKKNKLKEVKTKPKKQDDEEGMFYQIFISVIS